MTPSKTLELLERVTDDLAVFEADDALATLTDVFELLMDGEGWTEQALRANHALGVLSTYVDRTATR
jgi:hypothetical protein